MDKKQELILALEDAIEQLKDNDKKVIQELLKWLKASNNLYCHFIEHQCFYFWLVDKKLVKKSLISEIWGRG